MSSELVVEARNIVKTYQVGAEKINALDGIDLDVKKGEFLVVIGPSGSGKSTLLQIIGCLDRPTQGWVVVNNRKTSKLSDNALAYLRAKYIGFVFQSFHLLPRLTALENVAMPLVFTNVPRDIRLERAKEVLTNVGLEKRLNHFPSQLSGGEMQRVAIARALVNNPTLLLADEPTGNLDTNTGFMIMQIFRKINRMGKTVVVATHNKAVMRFGTRILELKDGKFVGEYGG
jgi:putative ABC transport system ATP-binding protein